MRSFSLHGLTRIEGVQWLTQLQHLPGSLQHLDLGDGFNQSLVQVNFPNNLKTLTLGGFNQSFNGVTLPTGLQTLAFGGSFNQSFDRVALPAGLQTLTFGKRFYQSLARVALPAGLQKFGDFGDSVGRRFTSESDSASWLQSLTFDNRRTLPEGLQSG